MTVEELLGKETAQSRRRSFVDFSLHCCVDEGYRLHSLKFSSGSYLKGTWKFNETGQNFIFYLLPSSWWMGGTKVVRNWLERPERWGPRDSDDRVPIWKICDKNSQTLSYLSPSRKYAEHIRPPWSSSVRSQVGQLLKSFPFMELLLRGPGLEFRALVYYSIISVNTKFLCCCFETAELR